MRCALTSRPPLAASGRLLQQLGDATPAIAVDASGSSHQVAQRCTTLAWRPAAAAKVRPACACQPYSAQSLRKKAEARDRRRKSTHGGASRHA
jgi:hypothetical protein